MASKQVFLRALLLSRECVIITNWVLTVAARSDVFMRHIIRARYMSKTTAHHF